VNLLNRFVALFREDDKVVFNRRVLEGRAVLDPELAKEYEKIYRAERTWGGDEELSDYLDGRGWQLIVSAGLSNMETLH
jgi:hypothetical protein